MQTMDASLAGLVRAGKITMAAAESRSSQPGGAAPARADASGCRQHRGWPPDGRRDLRLQGRRPRGRPAEGRARAATTKDAVTEELQRAGLTVMSLDEKKSGLQMELALMPKRVKAGRADGHDAPAGDDDLLGHDAPARVLRARGPGREREAARDRQRRPRGHRGRPRASPTRSPSTRRSSARSTSRWSAPARPAACSRSRSTASPTSSRRTTRCAARSRRAMAYPIVVLTLRAAAS